MRRAALSAAALFVAAAAAAVAQPLAQPPGERDFGDRMVVEEVLLDVVVTDRRGDLVLGLGPEDFVVRENGTEVPVRDVTFYSNRELLEEPEIARRLGVAPDEVPTDRYFIFFFDDPRATIPRLIAQQLDAARWARRWVRTLQPNDWVAIASYDRSLKIHHDFSTDHEAIAEAISSAATGDPPRAVANTEGPSLLSRLPGPQVAASLIYDGLAVVGTASGPVVGRKNLILFSIGFGEINSLGLYEPDMRYYPRLTEVLNDNNVAVYGIDLIPTSAFGSLRSNVLGNSLSNLASDTGGRYFYNFSNFLTPLEQIAEDTSGYYLLAYESRQARRANRFQKVDVDTRNPEFRVRSRRGYLQGN